MPDAAINPTSLGASTYEVANTILITSNNTIWVFYGRGVALPQKSVIELGPGQYHLR